MADVQTVGLDIAKNVFQVHGVDADGAVIFRKKLTRGKVPEFLRSLPPCLVGLKACASISRSGVAFRRAWSSNSHRSAG